MASRRAIKGRRAFLQQQVPLLIGRNPDRVAPAHIINGFLVAVYGAGPEADRVRGFLRSTGPLHWSGLSGAISGSQTSTSLFRDSLNVILNPDRRVFPTGGSPFPLHAALVSRNPSDDGFGRDVFELIAGRIAEKERILAELLAPRDGGEPLTALSRVLGNGYSPVQQTQSRRRDGPKWDSPRGSFAARFAESLAELVLSPTVLDATRLRSTRLVALTRGVACAAFLGSVRSAEMSSGTARSWDELAPMFFYGGVPPGRSVRPEVRLASQSFEAVVGTQKAVLQLLLLGRLKGKRLPKKAPANQRVEILFKLAFPDVKQTLLEGAAGAVRWSDDIERVARSLANALYPNGHLERAFRGLGRMLGMAGPDRGAGAPRFLLETPCLALLVACTTPTDESITYAEWLDRLYNKFGILAGWGNVINPEQRLKQIGLTGNLSRAIEANHEALRKRLVAAGLATEYSDGETEVHSQALGVGGPDA